jgi:hypothetical protein
VKIRWISNILETFAVFIIRHWCGKLHHLIILIFEHGAVAEMLEISSTILTWLTDWLTSVHSTWYFLTPVVWEYIVIVEKINLKFWLIFISSTLLLNMNKWLFKCLPPIYMFVCILTLVALELTDGFYSCWPFKNSSIVSQWQININLEFWTMDRVPKPIDSEFSIASSEPYRFCINSVTQRVSVLLFYLYLLC